MRLARSGLVWAAVVGLWGPAPAQAENEAESGAETAEPSLSGEVVALQRGQRAPFDGMLLEERDLVMWRLEIERLRFRLERDVQRAADIADAKLDLMEARVRAERSRADMRDGLWRNRVEELTDELRKVKQSAEAKWYESPALWFALGALSTTVVVVGISASQ